VLFEIVNTYYGIKVTVDSTLAWTGHLVRMNNDRALKYSTPNQMEQGLLEDRNCDGRMVLIKI
jgi:hypothetical protein